MEGIDRVHQQIRILSRGLMPVQIEAKGLWAALDDLADTVGKQTGVTVTFDCPQGCEVADHNRAKELFRIAQEAVSNALARTAQNIRLALLTFDRGLRLSIIDDGAGISPGAAQSTGMGLRIMQYRAEQIGAELHVGPCEEGGTIVTCFLGAKNDDGSSETRFSIRNDSQDSDRRRSSDRPRGPGDSDRNPARSEGVR